MLNGTFLNSSIEDADPEIHDLISQENNRQQNQIQLIASENFVSKAVLQAQGSILTNKYAEGYPGKRYYEGCEFVDCIENIAQERLRELFNASYVNVQPHSGSQANQAVLLALLDPGDTILGMSMNSGGHLTHGTKVNLSGKWFNPISYEVDKTTYMLDYDQIESLAIEHKPKMIIAGYSAYSRAIDFKRFREIADKVGAYLLADIAHISGIIAAGYFQNPVEYAHIITSTTHKTLRGPRGGIILSNDQKIMAKINKAVFPGLQGGPLMHVIAAKAVSFKEALSPDFKEYMRMVLDNASTLAECITKRGLKVLTGQTENHMVLVDLRDKKLYGKDTEQALREVGIICNRNKIPFDQTSAELTSGIRIGSPACTTQGLNKSDFEEIASMICDVIDLLVSKDFSDANKKQILDRVSQICKRKN